MKKTLVAAVTALMLLFGISAHATKISTFDVDTEGWTVSGLATLYWGFTFGNPGGHLVVAEGGGDTFEVVAPSKFMGNLSAYTGGTLSFDSILFAAGTSNPTFGSGFGKVTILGGGHSAELDLAPNPPETSWVNYSAALVASNWGVNETVWGQILSNVTQMRVILESVVGYEIMGLDNFKVQPVPEPGTLLLLGLGLAGLAGYSRRNRK